MMAPGQVIVLNGTSSAGKTTLARALQNRLAGTWLLIGIDTFLELLPRSFYERDSGMRFADDGTSVILDEVLLGGGADQASWASALSGLHVRWIAVRCDTDELVRREAMRGDRRRHLARWQAPRVHAGVRYDFEVDTTACPPDAAAEAIVAFVQGAGA